MDFIRFSSAESVWPLIIRSGRGADLSVKIGWTNPAKWQEMAEAAILCRE
jgi:hypothetical protein